MAPQHFFYRNTAELIGDAVENKNLRRFYMINKELSGVVIISKRYFVLLMILLYSIPPKRYRTG